MADVIALPLRLDISPNVPEHHLRSDMETARRLLVGAFLSWLHMGQHAEDEEAAELVKTTAMLSAALNSARP